MEQKKKKLLVLEDILGSNKKIAGEIRKKLEEHGILAVNLLSAPGSGKTSLLEKIGLKLKDNYRLGVIEGDIETMLEAESDAEGLDEIEREHYEQIKSLNVLVGEAAYIHDNQSVIQEVMTEVKQIRQERGLD